MCPRKLPCDASKSLPRSKSRTQTSFKTGSVQELPFCDAATTLSHRCCSHNSTARSNMACLMHKHHKHFWTVACIEAPAQSEPIAEIAGLRANCGMHSASLVRDGRWRHHSTWAKLRQTTSNGRTKNNARPSRQQYPE